MVMGQIGKIFTILSINNLTPKKTNYIFLDEVQYIENFERLLVGLQTKDNVDLYITGSNAYMLSSEMATLLSGRSVEISMLPLSFREYLEIFDDENKTRDEKFNNFLSYGGFPQAVKTFNAEPDSIDLYLTSIYDTVVGRDILGRENITTRATLDLVMKYLLDNIGNSTSINNIAEHLDLSRYKVEQIIDSLKASFLFYQLNRLDLKGKDLLKTQEKYYAVDLGLRWSILGRNSQTDRGHILENVVYLELLRRGAKISVGKIGNKEIDFVARSIDGNTSYYQVAWSVRDPKTLERELEPLRKVQDFNHRFLITLDPEEPTYEGIRQLNVINWLLKNDKAQ